MRRGEPVPELRERGKAVAGSCLDGPEEVSAQKGHALVVVPLKPASADKDLLKAVVLLAGPDEVSHPGLGGELIVSQRESVCALRRTLGRYSVCWWMKGARSSNTFAQSYENCAFASSAWNSSKRGLASQSACRRAAWEVRHLGQKTG